MMDSRHAKSFSTTGQQSCFQKLEGRKIRGVRRGYEWFRFLVKAASHRTESHAYAVAAFVSKEPFRPQNHPVMLQGTREKNPNNRWSKNITSEPLDRLIALRSTKHIGFPVAFSHFSFHQPPIPICFLSLYFPRGYSI